MMEGAAFDPGLTGGEVVDLARDVMLAYGDLSKGFVMAMVRKTAVDADPVARDLWLAVADIVWTIDPMPSAGCPAELADEIRLH
jgi:hypothetical protein